MKYCNECKMAETVGDYDDVAFGLICLEQGAWIEYNTTACHYFKPFKE